MTLNKDLAKDQTQKNNYTPNDLEAFWMPFTANQDFKADPRIVSKSKGMYYYTPNGDKVLDAVAGLWCCNAGHNRDEIVKAIQEQAAELDFVPSFQAGHYKAFELSNKLTDISPENLNHVFYSNSGSEAVETALKIALAYFRAIGQPSKRILIGRERGYHGTGFGGLSVGGMVNNKKQIERFLPEVYHLPHTHNLEHNSYSKGQPAWGAHLADDLLKQIEKHGAANIAAVIVEPVSGTGGVLIPPVGYLEKLRNICTNNDILLIFDEVITGFGRLGKPFASNYFNVEPDLFALAKGLTSGTVPMGATVVHKKIYDLFVNLDSKSIELYHGYTYSAHPLACAAALATIDLYEKENLLNKDQDLIKYFEDALHSLRGSKHVIDIRNIGLLGAIELEPMPNKPISRANEVFRKMFHEQNCYVRLTGGDVLTLAPPLIINKEEIDYIINGFKKVLEDTD
jgi:beta-alanine--pyruvate transaminase